MADPKLGFVWLQFSAYHMDRLEALGTHRGAPTRTIGIEIGSTSDTYIWPSSDMAISFTKDTLFPEANVDRLGAWAVFRQLFAAIRRHRISDLFIAGYEHPAFALTAFIARLIGVRVYVALDSKFDDKPRRLRLELFKRLLMLPYRGGFASGPRAADYLRFLGLHRRPIATGYDTVALARLRALAPSAVPAWERRNFVVVARFVPKKNLVTALHAFAAYRADVPDTRRRLRLCGSGEGETALRGTTQALGIADHVDFLGFVDQPTLSHEMANALCLLLPSGEEQWGLVVNEALAFDLPVLVSDRVGACDMLVGNWDNGFVLDPLDPPAWAAAMGALSRDRALWDRMTQGSRRRAADADVGAFVAGVERLAGTGR